MSQKIIVRKLSSAAGAEVLGLDVKKPLADAEVRKLHKALGENGVLLFRGLDIAPDEHIAFSKQFGPLQAHVLGEFALKTHPEVFVVSNVKEGGKLKGAVYAGQYWHSDLSYMQKPSLGSLLLCHEMPAIGGDTMFANMFMAYATLSAPMRKFIGGLAAIHDYSHAYDTYFAHLQERPPLTAEARARTPPVEHPMVRVHPVTKKKALYVNPGFTTGIVGMPKEESQPILDFLFRHSTRPEFIYRHKWKIHDMLFWDNRSVTHYALADYGFSVRRHMHRTTIAGVATH